ncbi:MAG: RNA methyltransferase [Candidatus Portnoybacteria bacterium CG03_land_8_20_14_0_80_41_10]|uniref:RNA methyltransferase n=1 Tax=Candidatus Portnoybacteria bacterium CG03_land_8_20_14_0_80_41_10 TaxID=1974808 RepID=A0A2M7BUX3_9BACT|nr:MAG: RNA methyltransferase [Candidatus Portnoybacteria bacterium CG03_land_8_20_14_0_80_41_10]
MRIRKKSLFFVICDNIRSLENIGSIFRTADALGVDKIFLTGICGRPPHPKIGKTALGAEKKIDWQYQWSVWRIIERLKKENFFIVALEQTKNSLIYTRFKPRFPLALVVGNEIKGVSPAVLKRADRVIHLPMLGRKESLNVAVSFGVAGYYLNQGRLEKGRPWRASFRGRPSK